MQTAVTMNSPILEPILGTSQRIHAALHTVPTGTPIRSCSRRGPCVATPNDFEKRASSRCRGTPVIDGGDRSRRSLLSTPDPRSARDTVRIHSRHTRNIYTSHLAAATPSVVVVVVGVVCATAGHRFENNTSDRAEFGRNSAAHSKAPTTLISRISR